MSEKHNETKAEKYQQKISWPMIFNQSFIHFGILVAFYYLMSGQVKLLTILWNVITTVFGLIGLTSGAHRLFSHRAYKATRALKLFLIFCHTMAGQESMFYWCRVHRTHHRFVESDKDPTDINRGLFYAYIGWICLTHTPEVAKEMERIDMNDLKADKDLVIQDRFYPIFFALITIAFPTLIPFYLWNESLHVAFWMNIARYAVNFNQLHIANGLLHHEHGLGMKPYDTRIDAKDNMLWNICTFGEGYHNYHHVFPYDYRAGEFGGMTDFNLGAAFVDFCAYFGWAYELKTVKKTMIERRVKRSGDGSHWMMKNNAFKEGIWGYGDEKIDPEDEKDLINEF